MKQKPWLCLLLLGALTVSSAQAVADVQVTVENFPKLISGSAGTPALRWDLSPSENLRENLLHWCKKASTDQVKWTLDWTSPWDYPVVAPTEFKGSFVSAVKDLMKQLKLDGSTLGIQIVLGNHVILVSERQ